MKERLAKPHRTWLEQSYVVLLPGWTSRSEMNISPRTRRPHASFSSLSGRALHSPALPPTPVVSGSCPAHCLTHLSVTSSTSGEGEQGGLGGRQRCLWCGHGRHCTHNGQMRSGGCLTFGFVSCFFHQVCFVWGKEELTPPAHLPLWVWYHLFCTQRSTVDGSDDDS